jgi:hypothetical protein
MEIGNKQDKYVVSTIIEDMFRYFDDEISDRKRHYRRLEQTLRLRTALAVFSEKGLAQFVGSYRPLPMWVPTKHLMDLLETSRLTTGVKPLTLSSKDAAPNDSEKHSDYARDFAKGLNHLADYIALMRPALGVAELGWAQHMREEDGRLVWSITTSGIDSIENGVVAELGLSDKPFGRN